MASFKTIPIDILRQALVYDPETGIIRWRIQPNPKSRRVMPGDEAGRIESDGYRRITIAGSQFQAHRIAWALHYGEWPHDQIDHRNGKRDANRIGNLRIRTPAQNCQNRQGPPSNNVTGYLGVSLRSNGRFRAQITRFGKSRHLGYFANAEAAHAARLQAESAHDPASKRDLRPPSRK